MFAKLLITRILCRFTGGTLFLQDLVRIISCRFVAHQKRTQHFEAKFSDALGR